MRTLTLQKRIVHIGHCCTLEGCIKNNRTTDVLRNKYFWYYYRKRPFSSWFRHCQLISDITFIFISSNDIYTKNTKFHCWKPSKEIYYPMTYPSNPILLRFQLIFLFFLNICRFLCLKYAGKCQEHI